MQWTPNRHGPCPLAWWIVELNPPSLWRPGWVHRLFGGVCRILVGVRKILEEVHRFLDGVRRFLEGVCRIFACLGRQAGRQAKRHASRQAGRQREGGSDGGRECPKGREGGGGLGYIMGINWAFSAICRQNIGAICAICRQSSMFFLVNSSVLI